MKKKEDDEQHTCSFCNEEFDSVKELQKHFDTVHPEKGAMAVDVHKSFVCEICHKELSTKGNLKVHQQIHSGVRPFKCSQCEKTFVTKANLQTHLRSHSGERPYTCGECSKSFTTIGNLHAHQRRHLEIKPYICSICDRGFSTKGNLNTHVKVHLEMRDHRCKECGKAFITKGNLASHLKTHSAEANESSNSLNENAGSDAGENTAEDEATENNESMFSDNVICLDDDTIDSNKAESICNTSRRIFDTDDTSGMNDIVASNGNENGGESASNESEKGHRPVERRNKRKMRKENIFRTEISFEMNWDSSSDDNEAFEENQLKRKSTEDETYAIEQEEDDEKTKADQDEGREEHKRKRKCIREPKILDYSDFLSEFDISDTVNDIINKL